MEYQRQFVAGPNYMEYEHQSQIIPTQSGNRPGGPINLPSLASSLKTYSNPGMHKGLQKQMSHSPHHKPPSLHAIRHDVVMRDKEKEADKAKKKGRYFIDENYVKATIIKELIDKKCVGGIA